MTSQADIDAENCRCVPGHADSPNCPVHGKKKKDRRAKEVIDHPQHYGGDTTYEVIKVLEAWGIAPDFCLGNAIKYIYRAGKKDGHPEEQDLAKAEWYLSRYYSLMDKSDRKEDKESAKFVEIALDELRQEIKARKEQGNAQR